MLVESCLLQRQLKEAKVLALQVKNAPKFQVKSLRCHFHGQMFLSQPNGVFTAKWPNGLQSPFLRSNASLGKWEGCPRGNSK